MTRSNDRDKSSRAFNRRKFMASSAAASGLVGITNDSWSARAEGLTPHPASRQASGIKIGEVTDSTALVWGRLTTQAARNTMGSNLVGHIRRHEEPPEAGDPTQLAGACPGATGKIRVRYGTSEDLSAASETPWVDVSSQTDYSHSFQLSGLRSATVYHVAVETGGPEGSVPHAPCRARFETAPAVDQSAEVRFCVTSCLMFADIDHADGFHIFPAMQKLGPQFVVFTGDNVYYDSEHPRAVTADLARYHWQRMYSLPRHVELIRQVASYWEKDDHDTHSDDSWPGMKPMGKFTFTEGQQVYRQQVPLAGPVYRTFRWGKWLQIWLTDGRDFRSPNNIADGPDKTIWGREQKAWLKRTLLESDARWKVLVSPTPIVGPDRPSKNDNHTNAGFSHEGNEFRHWVKENVPGNFFTVCGDRHWQYHSIHPETGLHEFACGAGSDQHSSGTPGYNEAYHRFHRVKGGFLSVTVRDGQIAFRHHDILGQVVHEWQPV
jgi:alkaline phosphatase D